jgi:anaerobic dimethyl sulfoxide reductase subunit B (iron-sulfur subunit)
MTQYGFFFDQSRCIGCKACVTACRDWMDTPEGSAKPVRLLEYEKGVFPNVRIHLQWVTCYHCENPVCVDAANGALIKEEKYGAVLIDPEKATSLDLRAAWQACPYGAIAFESDALDAKAYKCNMCIDRLETGQFPRCVEICPTRALDFGPISDMKSKWGSVSDLEDLPSSSITVPAVVFKKHGEKKTLVPYDSNAALQLLAKRDPYPAVYTTPADVTAVTPGLVGRSTLVLKPKNTEEFMQTSRHDEG